MRVKRDPLDGAAAPDALSKSQANQFWKKTCKELNKKYLEKFRLMQNWLLEGWGGGVAVVHVLKEDKNA